MHHILNFIVNPKKFFDYVLSFKNDRIFLIYLIVCCSILAVSNLGIYNVSDDERDFSTFVFKLIVGLIEFPILLYLFAFITNKLSDNKRSNHYTEKLFRIISYSIAPVAFLNLLDIFFPNNQAILICLQLVILWSFGLWIFGHSYVMQTSLLRSFLVIITPFLILKFIATIFNS